MAFALVGLLFTACDNNDWTTDPSLADVYYVGIEDTLGLNNNKVVMTVEQGNSTSVGIQFFSEQRRGFDVTTYYYVAGDLKRGVDYDITDASGTVLQPATDGSFPMTWANALKGVQQVYIKTYATGGKGTFTVLTHDPNNPTAITAQDIATTVNNKTGQYEVRTFSQNYLATVTIN